MSSENTDEILGITRCARCGQRLNGDIECPVCSGYYDSGTGESSENLPGWIYLTACFLTSPLSLWAIWTTARLGTFQKIFASAGCLMWLGVWRLLA